MNTSGSNREPETKKMVGQVLRRRVAEGSKSDRMAIVLRTKDGNELILRREKGNAFQDATLDRLVGATIDAEGLVAGQTLILKSWRVRRRPVEG